MGTTKEQTLIAALIATFPATFGLKAFAGTFRISAHDSYFFGPGECVGVIILYTEKRYNDAEFSRVYGRTPKTEEERWVSFAKGTESELRRTFSELPGLPAPRVSYTRHESGCHIAQCPGCDEGGPIVTRAGVAPSPVTLINPLSQTEPLTIGEKFKTKEESLRDMRAAVASLINRVEFEVKTGLASAPNVMAGRLNPRELKTAHKLLSKMVGAKTNPTKLRAKRLSDSAPRVYDDARDPMFNKYET